MDRLTEYFVRHYTLVIDNTEQSYSAATRAAVRVVRDSDVSAEKYAAMSSKERAEEYAAEIGSEIIDLISAWFTEQVTTDTIGGMLAHEVMILASSDVEWHLGEHYMPEDSDIVHLLDDSGDDDE